MFQVARVWNCGLILAITVAVSLPGVCSGDDTRNTPVVTNELLSMVSQYRTRREQFWKRLGDAATEGERKEILSQDPDDDFIPKILMLEELNRGTDVGLLALHFVIRNAKSYGAADATASKGKVTACKRLALHYLDHPDADECLTALDGGVRFPETLVALRQLAERSTHKHVRGAAWFYLACMLNEKANIPTYQEQARMNLRYVEGAGEDLLQNWLNSLDLFGEVDIRKTRADAAATARYVLEHYADTRHPTRDEMPFGRGGDGAIRRTFGEMAESLLFEIERLSVGSVSPDILGTDVEGMPFRLSEYRGHVVAILFAADWCGPCKAMYPELRRLQKRFRDEPFALVSVMADATFESVQRSVKDGDVTWRAVWDGNKGPIATQWNIKHWPTLYVIDQRGIIRHRGHPSKQVTTDIVASILGASVSLSPASAQAKPHLIPTQ